VNIEGSAAPSTERETLLTRIDFSSALTPQLKNNLREIVGEHPEGVWCSQLSQLVRVKYYLKINEQIRVVKLESFYALKSLDFVTFSLWFQEKFGVPLNYRKYGFTSMLQLVDSIKEFLIIEKKESSDWLLLTPENAKSTSVADQG